MTNFAMSIVHIVQDIGLHWRCMQRKRMSYLLGNKGMHAYNGNLAAEAAAFMRRFKQPAPSVQHCPMCLRPLAIGAPYLASHMQQKHPEAAHVESNACLRERGRSLSQGK